MFTPRFSATRKTYGLLLLLLLLLLIPLLQLLLIRQWPHVNDPTSMTDLTAANCFAQYLHL